MRLGESCHLQSSKLIFSQMLRLTLEGHQKERSSKNFVNQNVFSVSVSLQLLCTALRFYGKPSSYEILDIHSQ